MKQAPPESGPSAVWITLQVQESCVLEHDYEAIASDLRGAFGNDVEFFLPIHVENVGGRPLCRTLVEGYVWVMLTTLEALDSRLDSLSRRYFQGPLRDRTGWHFVSGREIQRYKDTLNSHIKAYLPEVQECVKAKEGTFKDIEGIVLSVDLTTLVATVSFKMRSRTVTAPVKVLNLEPAKKTPHRRGSF